MPNWPISSARVSSLTSSPPPCASRSFARVSAVPDFAIVPMRLTTSSRLIPMPLSVIVSARFAGSVCSSMCRSEVSTPRSLSR